MTRKAHPTITQNEVSSALAQFLQKGGVIKKLPAQQFHVSETVGGDKYDAYESLTDLPAMVEGGERPA